MSALVSVLIPASNEAGFIGPCLKALLASDPVPGCPVEVLVIANGCTDDTVTIARRFHDMAETRGWRLVVLDLEQGGKLAALNQGDRTALGDVRIYLDADVIVSPMLIAELAQSLQHADARYASGTPVIAPSANLITRLYGRFWQQVPFLRDGAPGFGVYAVNAAGRSRWAEFPDIISDDTFVRLQFAPDERVQVPARYTWPLVDGFRNLVRVRRRQDLGVREIATRFPELLVNDTKPRADLPALMRRDPLGFLVYASVALAVRLGARRKGTLADPSDGGQAGAGEWSRGR
ncbi:MAG: glycosyltransferase [Roseinatronobacter sp.]